MLALLVSAFCGTAWSKDGSDVRLLADDMYPLHYIDPDGKRQGVISEIVQSIVDRANIDATSEYAPWPRAYKSALKLKNILIYSVVRTKKRENQFNWIGPIYTIEKPRLYSWSKRKLAKPESLEALSKFTVCAMQDTWFYRTLVRSGHFVEGENLLENWRGLQALAKEEVSYQRVTKVLKKLYHEDPCDFRVMLPIVMDSYMEAAALPRQSLTSTVLPQMASGSVVHFNLAASMEFDAQLLSRLKEAHRELQQSGALLRLCEQRSKLSPEIYCQQLRPQG